MKILRGFVLLVLTFVLPAAVVQSQVPVEISKEKVIISGAAYYIHIVKKGQTAYSISRAYGISIQELTDENPASATGLKEGQRLKIPVRKDASAGTVRIEVPSVPVRDETRYLYHSLRPGETIYSLSRLYGVSEADIVNSNSGIEINKLPVGSEIAVPKRDFMNPKEKFTDQEKKYFYHKVVQGETLSSIAKSYGLTLRELRRENRNMRFPQVGDFVKIPASAAPEAVIPEPVAIDTTPPVREDEIILLERPEGFTRVSDLQGTMDIAVLLPFYLDRNSKRTEVDSSVFQKGKRQYRIEKLPDEWIFPQSLDFLEMYNGILLAADTLRSLGLDITIHTFDIRSDTVELTRLINSGRLDDMDLIIGPVYSHNLQIASRHASPRGIPVVSPVALINNDVLQGNPTVFMANASLEVAQETLAAEIGLYNQTNLVFIHTDSSGTDPDVKRYRELIFNEVTSKTNFEDIRFKELIFYPRSAFGNDSINRISHSLNENVQNIVIIASEEPPVVSEILTIVHGLSKRFDIQVFGYPSMIYLDNLDPRIYYEMNQLIFSPYRVEYSKDNVRRFNINYLKKFMTMPLETSYAWMGYDIGYYFISGLAMHDVDFIDHPEIHNPELLQNEFIFRRKTVMDGFENQRLFRLRYSRDYTVIYEDRDKTR